MQRIVQYNGEAKAIACTTQVAGDPYTELMIEAILGHYVKDLEKERERRVAEGNFKKPTVIYHEFLCAPCGNEQSKFYGVLSFSQGTFFITDNEQEFIERVNAMHLLAAARSA